MSAFGTNPTELSLLWISVFGPKRTLKRAQ